MGGEPGSLHPARLVKPVVVDTNLAFRALASGGGELRNQMDPTSRLRLHSPRFLFVELFKHKERLLHASRLTEEELLEALQVLVARIEFINESNIPLGTWMEAHRLCRDVDEKDTAFVALTLHLDGQLWTEDEELKAGLRAKGYNRFFTQ